MSDGRWLIVTRAFSNARQELWLVDLTGAESPRLLTRAGEEAVYEGPQWSSTGEYLYCVSDFERECPAPARIRLETGELLREPYERSGRCFQADVQAWRGAFDGSAFEPPRDERLSGETTRSGEELATLFCSTSSISSLDPAEREALRGRLIGVLSGEYRLPVEVELVWTRLR